MAPPDERAGSICIYIISSLFFLTTMAGGVCLVLYVTLPEEEDTIWFAIFGMALVAIPWVFWITMCLYRAVACRDANVEQRAPVKIAAVAPVASGATATMSPLESDSPADSPGGARRVRFGAATVMGNEEGNAGGTSSGAGKSEQDGDSNGTTASSTSNEGSSLASHESEVPLAFSIS